MIKLITIDDVATARFGREIQTDEDFASVGLQLFGGCEICAASIACYNAYPARSGYWRCGDCIAPEMGFETVQQFEEFLNQQREEV